jgi:hypothetical protein
MSCARTCGRALSNLTLLSYMSDTEDKPEPRFDSTLSSILGDKSDSEPNGDNGKAQMQVDNDVCLLPLQNELKTLIKALMEYAEVLDWQVWHMQEEPGQDSKERCHDQRQGQGQDQGSWWVMLEQFLLLSFY